MKEVLGDKPLIVKLNVTDWHPEGITKDEVEYVAKQLKNLDVDMINVSTGNTVIDQKPFMGRMWQTPFSEWIRNTIEIPTMTSGRIETIDQVNTLLLNARADLVALGRPLLTDPYFVQTAKAYEQYKADDPMSIGIPQPYLGGAAVQYMKAKKDREEFEQMKKELKPVSHQLKK